MSKAQRFGDLRQRRVAAECDDGVEACEVDRIAPPLHGRAVAAPRSVAKFAGERFEERGDEMIFAVFDEHVTLGAEREDRRARSRRRSWCGSRRCRRVRAGERARARPAGARDETVENVEAAELVGDDGLDRVAPKRAEQRVEGIVDGRKRVSGSCAHRVAGASARRENPASLQRAAAAPIAPTMERTDFLTIASSLQERQRETPRGPRGAARQRGGANAE